MLLFFISLVLRLLLLILLLLQQTQQQTAAATIMAAAVVATVAAAAGADAAALSYPPSCLLPYPLLPIQIIDCCMFRVFCKMHHSAMVIRAPTRTIVARSITGLVHQDKHNSHASA